MKDSAARSLDRKQGGVDSGAVALGNSVEGDVDNGVSGISGGGALIESKGGVGVTQHGYGEAANLEFVTQEAGKSEGDVFFCEFISESGAAFITTVGGIDDNEWAMNDGRGWSGSLRGGRGYGGGRRGGWESGKGDGPAIAAKTGDEGIGCGDV